MTINSGGSGTELIIGSSAVTLKGGGTVTMSNNAANEIVEGASGDKLTNQETTQRAGQIGKGSLTLVNSGTINANESAGLIINAASVTNRGRLEATAGSSLALYGTYANAGGTIEAVGSGSLVTLGNGTTITGGTLASSSGGLTEAGPALLMFNWSTSSILLQAVSRAVNELLCTPAF